MSEPGGTDPPTAQSMFEQVEPRLVRAAPDPWAHRRAEPRPLALLWTLYLLGACILTLGPLIRGGLVGPDVCRPATRLLLAIVGIGMGVVWPLIRLSQARAGPAPVKETVKDLLVLVAPVQLLIWPHLFHWLSAWPIKVVAALSGWSLAWGALVGGVLALALSILSRRPTRGPSHVARTVWMGGFLALALAGPPLVRAVMTLVGGSVAAVPVHPGSSPASDPTWLASPVFAVFELAAERPERVGGAGVPQSSWGWLAVVAALAVLAWAAAARVARGRPAPLAPGPSAA